MKKLISIALPVVLAGTLSACMVHETPYSYGTPVAVQASTGYPLYYADGAYWAYQYDTWYWWANDHWITSTYAPHGAVLVDSHHVPVHHGTPHHGSTHGVHHGSSHHSSHGSSHHGHH